MQLFTLSNFKCFPCVTYSQPNTFSFVKPDIDVTCVDIDNSLIEKNICHEIVSWDCLKRDEFRSGLDVADVHIIENSVDDISQFENISQTNIDDVLSGIKDIFHKSARNCKIKRQIRFSRNKRVTKRKDWFNHKCESKRKDFFILS